MIVPVVNAPKWQQVWIFVSIFPFLLMAFVPNPPDAPTVPHWELLLSAVFIAVLLKLALGRLRYCLTSDGLEIDRLLAITRLPYTGMQARRTAGRLGVRTFGTGLPGYLTGAFTFSSDSVRSVTALASVGSGGVLIGVPVEGKSEGRSTFVLPPHPATAGQVLRWYFLTPADPQQFLDELAQRGAVVGQ
jgi:hypothetical protein